MKKCWMAFALLLLFTLGCEKDDICDESARTTPRLIVSFYDFANANDLKNVNALEVYGQGAVDVLGVYTDINQIALPLRTTDDVTTYKLKLNSTSQAANTDYLQINYARQTIYVSRACGFKTTFSFNTTDAIILTDEQPADGTWIKNITYNTLEVSNEDEAHINIYF